MRVLSGLSLMLLVMGLSMPVLAEESAGDNNETSTEQTDGQASKPAESGSEKPKKADEEPGCSD